MNDTLPLTHDADAVKADNRPLSAASSADIHPTASVHPAAIVEPGATIGAGVSVGPWTFIGAGVEVGAGTRIHSHVVLKGPTVIGKNNIIYQFASVGEACQDKKYTGEPTRLVIGDNNIIRECCTIHRGTAQDKWLTSIGNNNLLMAYVHIAHDCVIGNDCIFANSTALAGHVIVDDGAIMGGYTAVHQFCRIGAYSMTAGQTGLFKDLPAFTMASGNPAKTHGMNVEGMRRRGYSQELIGRLKECYKIIYRRGLRMQDAIEQLQSMQSRDPEPEVQLLIDSLLASTRGITR